mgnify:CR=1 FL=1
MKGRCESCYWYEVGCDLYTGGNYAECHNPDKRKLSIEDIDSEWGVTKPCPFWRAKEEVRK